MRIRVNVHYVYLTEEHVRVTSLFLAFQEMKWADDKDTDHCQLCKQVFSISRRKVSVH